MQRMKADRCTPYELPDGCDGGNRFKQLMAQQTGQDVSAFENMTIEQIGEMMHVELKSFRQKRKMRMETRQK